TSTSIANLLPGVAVAALVMHGGFYLADFLGQALLSAQGITAGVSPVSGVPVAILLGLGARNLLPLPVKALAPGLKFCTTTALRAGIICVGAKLSAADVLALGAAGVPAVAVSIGAGLFVVRRLGRAAGLAPRMTALIAAGTSICGVTAITALAPAIRATPQEVAFAVANVVAFGTLGMLAYPYVAHHLLPHSEQVGLFLGLAIHDTAQVVGAALTYRDVSGEDI
ncbi:unnamed protein product, partial [Phaeothamnion confervicola]